MVVADTDESGTIDFDEWTKFINKLEDGEEDQTKEDDLRKIFDEIDTDGDGELTVEEFG